MNGTAFESETVFSQMSDTSWEIAGTGDFNNDGKWTSYGGTTAPVATRA